MGPNLLLRFGRDGMIRTQANNFQDSLISVLIIGGGSLHTWNFTGSVINKIYMCTKEI